MIVQMIFNENKKTTLLLLLYFMELHMLKVKV